MDVTIPKTIGSSALTRATIATYYNSAGKLSVANNNVLRVGYDPANLAAAPMPILEAASFNVMSNTESFTDGWTAGNSYVLKNQYGTKAPDGSYTSNYLAEDATNNAHQLVISAAFGTSVPTTFSIYAKAGARTKLAINTTSGPVNGTALFDLVAGTVSFLSNGMPPNTAAIQSVGNGWYRCSMTQQAGAGSITMSLYNGATVYTGDGFSGLYIWGSQSEAGSMSSYIPSTQSFTSRSTVGTYVNSSGRLASAAINTSRINYTADDLTVAPKLLLEKAATNICLRSADFSTLWTNSNVTQTSGAADPFNTGSGSTLADNSTSVVGKTSQNITVANNSNPYVFSIYIQKTASATVFPGVSLALSGGTGITVGVALNTNTGATIQNSAMSAPPYLVVSSVLGFWRITIGITNNSTGNTVLTPAIYPSADNGGTGTWDVTQTTSAVVYGAQVEQSVSETSYINTAGTAVTRAADIFTSTPTTRAADVSSFGLIYTNIPENDFPAWASGTTYGIDVSGSNSVIYNHVKYASLQASNVGHQPDISPTWWSVIGSTNAYAMFDSQVGTQTVGAVGGHVIVYVQIGALSSLNFINVVADSITATLYSNYTQVYTNTIDMTGGTTGVPLTDYTLTGLQTYSDGYVKLDIYSAASAPAIGNFVVGTNYYLGSTETSPIIGIVDYSVKTIDAFGNPTLTVRGYAKRMNTKSVVPDSLVDIDARLLAQVRAKPCVWNGNTTMTNPVSNNKTSLIIYGYYKDWEIDCNNKNISFLTLQVEGLI